MQNLGDMMRKAQEVQQKIAEMQQRLTELEVIGQAGGGLVVATLNGKGEAKKIAIDPKAINPAEKEMLEDLVVAAFNDAKAKIDGHIAFETEKMMSSLPLPPGMKLPF